MSAAASAAATTTRASRRTAVADYSLLDTGAAESIYGDADRFAKLLAAKTAGMAPASAHMPPPLPGAAFNLSWVRTHGLRAPVKILDRTGLGLALPGPGFTVRDVADLVGPATPLDVMDVASQQETLGWNLAMWADYFHGKKERKAVLNVISLEFSGTPLEAFVRAPRVVRQLDWIDTVWPGHRRAAGQYPQVQFYCLMSVAGSWTDFHVDFGGTSVWYHVHTGRKTFLFVPPTPANLAAYESWTTSASQASTFFGDLADTCFSVTLDAGNTLIIPTGWIHAVHTPQDSLVFGGNFLHGFDMPGQLRIFELEQFTKVPRKYRFPYYEHMEWYAAAYYLQFARVPGFGELLREAYGVAARRQQTTQEATTAAVVDVAGAAPTSTPAFSSAPSSAASNAASEFDRLTAALHARGLSWAEITGLPALLKTLTHIQAAATASAEQRQQRLPPRNGHHAAAGAAGSNNSDGGGGLKLKLRVGGSGAGSANGPSVAAAGPAAPRNRRAMRVKGAVGSSSSNQSAAEAASAASPAPRYTGEHFDEFDAFPAAAAAQEAAAMGAAQDQFDPTSGDLVAPAGPETLLAELTARLDTSLTVGEVEAAWPTPKPPSVLRMHHAGGGGVGVEGGLVHGVAAVAPSPPTSSPGAGGGGGGGGGGFKLKLKLGGGSTAGSALAGSSGVDAPALLEDAALAKDSSLVGSGGLNVPKGSVGNPPLRAVRGGFGLYDGRVRAFPGERDDVTHTGGGYAYNEVFGPGGGAGGGGGGDDSSEGGGSDSDMDEEAAAAASKRGRAGASAKRKRRGDDDDEDYGEEEDDDLFDAGECAACFL